MTNHIIHKPSKSILFPQSATIPKDCKQRLVSVKGKTVRQVKHDEDNVRLLWDAGFTDVLAPVEVYHTFKPLVKSTGEVCPTISHQIKTVAYFSVYKKAITTSGLGSGKTHCILSLIDYGLGALFDKVMIVSPKTVVRQVWAKAIDESFGFKYDILFGTAGVRKNLLYSDTEIKLINVDGVQVLKDELPSWITPRILIVYDEASMLKVGAKLSARTKTFIKLVEKDCRVALATATPAPEAPWNPWSLCKIINPKTPGFYSFKQQVAYKYGPFEWRPYKNAHETIAKYLQPCIHFDRNDVVGMPPLVYERREVEPSEEQKKHLKTLREEAKLILEDTEHLAVNSAVVFGKVLQTLLGVVKVGEEYVTIDGFENRVKEVLSVVEEADAKVIVVVPFKGALRKFKELVSKHYTCEIINGDTKDTDRNRIFSTFQDTEDIRVLAVHPEVASFGINLQSCHVMIFFGPVLSNDEAQQVVGRISRMGQRNAMTVLLLGGDKIEWKRYDILEEREENQNKVLDLMKDFAYNG